MQKPTFEEQPIFAEHCKTVFTEVAKLQEYIGIKAFYFKIEIDGEMKANRTLLLDFQTEESAIQAMRFIAQITQIKCSCIATIKKDSQFFTEPKYRLFIWEEHIHKFTTTIETLHQAITEQKNRWAAPQKTRPIPRIFQ
jgi:hypothetical protein